MATWKQNNKAHYNAWQRQALQRPDVRAQALMHGIKRRTKRAPDARLELVIVKAILRNRCALCGFPFIMSRRDYTLSPSCDKIDPAGDYTPSNMQVVHFECNRIKGRLPQRVVKKAIRQIMRRAYGKLFRDEAGRLGASADSAARREGDRKGKA